MTALKYWDGAAWQTVPAIQGPTGPAGPTGPQGVAGEMAAYANSGPLTSIPVAWKTMPLSATPVVEPSGAFVQNADNSISVTVSGWYYVTIIVHGTWNTAAVLLTSIAFAPNSEGGVGSGVPGVTGGGPRSMTGGLFKLTPADKVYPCAWSQAVQNGNLMHFSAVKMGGPKGDPGGAANAIAQSYTVSGGYTKDRAFNAAGFTTPNEIAAVLATLIDDMKAAGLITGP